MESDTEMLGTREGNRRKQRMERWGKEKARSGTGEEERESCGEQSREERGDRRSISVRSNQQNTAKSEHHSVQCFTSPTFYPTEDEQFGA